MNGRLNFRLLACVSGADVGSESAARGHSCISVASGITMMATGCNDNYTTDIHAEQMITQDRLLPIPNARPGYHIRYYARPVSRRRAGQAKPCNRAFVSRQASSEWGRLRGARCT
jgi:hypothetical protein